MVEKKTTTQISALKPKPKRIVQQLIPQYEEITHAHFVLLREYISVLNDVSKQKPWVVEVGFLDLEPLIEMLDITEKRREHWMLRLLRILRIPLRSLPTLSYLVRLFVESHVKGKLNELSIAYSYLLQTIPQDYPSVENYRSWLKDTSETCERLSSTLRSLQSVKGVASTLWPVLVSAAATILGVSTLKELIDSYKAAAFNWADLLPWLTFIVFPLVYLGIFVTGAFWYKRELFTRLTFSESIVASILPALFERHQDSANIYQLENMVFSSLDRGKTLEFQWDILTVPITVGSFALLGLSDWIQDPSKSVDWPIVIISLVGIIGSINLISRRKWR